MTLTIKPLESFTESIKKLAKKYKNIALDLKDLQKELQNNPEAGIKLGNHCYKIRVANSSIPTGKRSGFRVVYYKKIVTNHPIKFEKTFKIHRNITLKGGSYLAPPML